MYSGTKLEANHGNYHIEAHSAPKMEAQSWRFNMFSANLVKRMQTWATEAQNLKGPQLT